MRNYREFVEDIMDSKQEKERGGLDLEATQQLGRDVSDFRRFNSQFLADKKRVEWDAVREVLADRLAVANDNYDPDYQQQACKFWGLGAGEVMHRTKNSYKMQLMFPDSLDRLVEITDQFVENVALREMSREDWERLQESQYQQEMMEDVQEDMNDYKREEYNRVLQDEGFPLDTAYDGLPAYVTAKLDSIGITQSDVEEMSSFTNDDLLLANEFARMERDGVASDKMRSSSVNGRIYGDGNSKRNGIDGFCDDEYVGNGTEYDF